MRLQTIREALKAKLQDLERSPTIFDYDPEARTGHNITVIPADEYIVQETIGDDYGIGLQFDLRIEVPGRLKDSQIAMDDYLSTGAGSTSSVIDAILTGAISDGVEDVMFLGVDGPDLDVDPLTAVVHFRFMVTRG